MTSDKTKYFEMKAFRQGCYEFCGLTEGPIVEYYRKHEQNHFCRKETRKLKKISNNNRHVFGGKGKLLTKKTNNTRHYFRSKKTQVQKHGGKIS